MTLQCVWQQLKDGPCTSEVVQIVAGYSVCQAHVALAHQQEKIRNAPRIKGTFHLEEPDLTYLMNRPLNRQKTP